MTTRWHYRKGDRQIGPVSFGELRLLVYAGKICPADLVCNDASNRWVAAASVPGLLLGGAYGKTASASAHQAGNSGTFDTAQAQPFWPWALVVMAGCAAVAVAALVYAVVTTGGRATPAADRAAVLDHAALHPKHVDIEPAATRAAYADAREITEAYRTFAVFVSVAYVDKESFLVWSAETHRQIAGAGLILANDRSVAVILTNRHVIDPSYSEQTTYRDLAVAIKLASETEWRRCAVAAVHSSLDLALLIVDMPFAEPRAVQVVDRLAIEQGEAVVALGNPLGVEFVTTEGIVSKVADAMILHSCPINSGNSGGPLILKRAGLVAGINTLTKSDAQNFNFALCADQAFAADAPWVWLERQKDARRLLQYVTIVR